RIPVRVTIQSLLVSTSFSRSAFDRIFFGTAEPTPATRARIIARSGSGGRSGPRLAAGRPGGLPRLAGLRLVGVQRRDRGADLLREALPRELRREPDRV